MPVIEQEADEINFRAVLQLLPENSSAPETMIWKEIIDDFEGYYDDCEDVGDVIKNVVLKNS